MGPPRSLLLAILRFNCRVDVVHLEGGGVAEFLVSAGLTVAIRLSDCVDFASIENLLHH